MTRPEKIVRRFIRDHGPVFLNDNEMPDSVREVRVALDELVAERDRLWRECQTTRDQLAEVENTLRAERDRLREEARLLREECADWERGADDELARAWKERAEAAEAERDRYDNDRRTAMEAAERFREQGMKDAAQRDRYKQALEYYAARHRYHSECCGSCIHTDGGSRARAALDDKEQS